MKRQRHRLDIVLLLPLLVFHRLVVKQAQLAAGVVWQALAPVAVPDQGGEDLPYADSGFTPRPGRDIR